MEAAPACLTVPEKTVITDPSTTDIADLLFKREDKSKFDAALTELQSKHYLTMCGREQKLSQTGESYGWASTVFCTVEEFWGADVMDKSESLDPAEAEKAITERILTLNPAADRKRMVRFIKG